MIHRLAIRLLCVLLLPVASGNTFAHTAVDVCHQPAVRPEVSIRFSRHQVARIEPLPGSTRQQHRNFDVLARAGSTRLTFGYGHRYTLFDFANISPQTNAHLHTAYFPLHWTNESQNQSFRLSIAPTLSASSNLIGRPTEHRGETLHWLFALAGRRNLDDRTTLLYGVCGDLRFGEYKVYPQAAIEWTSGPDWLFEAGFPRSRVLYRLTDVLTSTLQVAPDGSEWRVMNRERTERSQFNYEAYALDWSIEWQAGSRIAVSMSVGKTLRDRLRLTLVDGQRVRLSTESVLNAGFGLRWRF